MAIPLDELVSITLLTVAVTVGATALGSLLGIPLGVLLVLERFPGRGAIRTIVYALYAFPPIVAGVLLYLLLRRRSVERRRARRRSSGLRRAQETVRGPATRPRGCPATSQGPSHRRSRRPSAR